MTADEMNHQVESSDENKYPDIKVKKTSNENISFTYYLIGLIT